jgi:bifunctional oligoribonuclease and PAP phosphatase NrnA
MQWNEAKALVERANRIIIVTHMFPDGDAIGSVMGLTHTLRALGKEVIPAVDGGVPKHLAFIPGSEGILPALTNETADLVFSLDASDAKRSGEAGAYAFKLGVPIIVIDHHATNTNFGAINLVNWVTPATCEVLVDWFTAVGWAIPQDAAYALLTGIVTDTQCFRISQTTAETLRKAQYLMTLGASLTAITQQTVNRRSTAAFRLWAKVMPSLQIEDGVIWAVVDLEAKKAARYEEEGGAGGLASLLAEADEAFIVGVFLERTGNRVEMHFRAQPGYDVSQLAFNLGGGGHRQASGATVDGGLQETVERVIPILKEAARAGSLVIA